MRKLVLGTLFLACADSTHVTLRLELDSSLQCRDIRQVEIYVASDPAEAERRAAAGAPVAVSKQCGSDGSLGTLVLTKDAADTIAVLVLAGTDRETCRPPLFTGCLVARRRTTFIEGKGGTLPITLDGSCRNVPCDALSTCRQGACVTSDTE